jgi:hypothetical protein
LLVEARLARTDDLHIVPTRFQSAREARHDERDTVDFRWVRFSDDGDAHGLFSAWAEG